MGQKTQQTTDMGSGPEALSSILRELRFSGVLCCQGCFSPPWGLSGQDSEAPIFHYVKEGRGTLVHGGESIDVQQGDLIVFPHGSGHTLHDGSAQSITPLRSLLPLHARAGTCQLALGEGKASMRALCGLFFIEKQAKIPLWSALPQRIVLPHHKLAKHEWLPTMLESLFAEASSAAPGSGLLASKMSELIFLLALRHYISQNPAPSGWLYALQEPGLGRVLGLIHSEYAAPWSLKDLAKQARMSRTQLATTFKRHTGTSPMAYLKETRMRHASRMLREDALSLKEIAAACGYHSQIGFHNAFKRLHGTTPGAFRKQQANTSPSV